MRIIKVKGLSRDFSIEFIGLELPAKRIICPRCDGEGKHVNPNIDGNGLSQEDFAEDPDFAESYFTGLYDVSCEECGGNRVVDIVDEELVKNKLSWWKNWHRHMRYLDSLRESEAEHYYEQRVGL